MQKHLVYYLGLKCELTFVQQDDWGYIDKEFWQLWTTANNASEWQLLEQNGFSLFDKAIFYKEIDEKTAHYLLKQHNLQQTI